MSLKQILKKIIKKLFIKKRRIPKPMLHIYVNEGPELEKERHFLPRGVHILIRRNRILLA